MIIGNDVWIGSGVEILRGVTIGDGVVVGAGSVVTKDISPYAIAVGNPAKVLKYRFDELTVGRLLKIKWWDFDYSILKQHIYLFQSSITEDTLALLEEIRTVGQ